MLLPHIGVRPSLKDFIAGKAGLCVLFIFLLLKCNGILGCTFYDRGVSFPLASVLLSLCLPWDWERFGIPMRKVEHKKKCERHVLILKSQFSLSSFGLVCPEMWNTFCLEEGKKSWKAFPQTTADKQDKVVFAVNKDLCWNHGHQKASNSLHSSFCM